MDRFKQILTDINETLVSNRTQATKHLVQTQENMDDDTREQAYEMAVGSLKSIVSRAAGVLKKLEDPEKMDQIQQGLTEPWVQSKITLAEDYVRTIHDFVIFSEQDDDKSMSQTYTPPTRKDLTDTEPQDTYDRMLSKKKGLKKDEAKQTRNKR